MSEVKRYQVVKMLSDAGNKIAYDPHGPWIVMARDFDRVTAERDAALGREAALIEAAKVDALGIQFEQKRVQGLQQRLTAADERADVLSEGEPVAHTMKSVMAAICSIDGFPMLTSNQCHALAVKLNENLGAKT